MKFNHRIVYFEIKTDGTKIFCPRCGKSARVKAHFSEFGFYHFVECSCTDRVAFYLKSRRKKTFKAWQMVHDFEIKALAKEAAA